MPSFASPSIVSLHDVSCTTPDGTPLFGPLSVAFGTEKTGLVGRNGIGKSTLLRIIAGIQAPSSGHRDVPGETAGIVPLLAQDLGAQPWRSVADAFGASDALARIDRLLAGTGTPDDADRADWTLEDRIAECLRVVGLHELDPRAAVDVLSGGQRTRLAVAAAIWDSPPLVLFDEPTNNLDADGRSALIDVLNALPGGCVVVSHDRTLLGHMDRIVEMSDLGACAYGGNWDLYAATKERERAAAAHDLAEAEKHLDAIKRRNRDAQERKARRDAGGRRSRLRNDMPKIAMNARRDTAERSGARGNLLQDRLHGTATDALAQAEARVERNRILKLATADVALPAARTVLSFDRVTAGPAPGITTLREFSMTITGPRRLAVRGPNGSGKSTLLRLAAGTLVPDSGAIRRTVRLAMLDQDVTLLRRDMSLLGNLRRLDPGLNDNEGRRLLAAFLFRGGTVHQPVDSLSGGERVRAGLACVLGTRPAPELLILDEPTNHLDLESIAAVESALRSYGGALLIASHDPAFLRAVGADQTIDLPSTVE
ncbi:ABC-F family ATP-binding cassette domain-containing protein [Fodinicurvata sp. EGI_FJ10296]|uniref:ABC-F family ATP-binding cassette domain-containing protein n=1 Tax=Fodinicurvata sp. EGI_FJ10296 TaxID=3231908 RepID=UPI003452E982